MSSTVVYIHGYWATLHLFPGYYAFVFCVFFKAVTLNSGVFPVSGGVAETPVWYFQGPQDEGGIDESDSMFLQD